MTDLTFAKETVPANLEQEMRRSYLDYAMSVIVGCALPAVRAFAGGTVALVSAVFARRVFIARRRRSCQRVDNPRR